jgi:hypothetical protein
MACTARDAFIRKIFAKTTQLQSSGLHKEDRDIIKGNRLNIVWLEHIGESVPSQTRWRQARARDNFREIREVSSHLFLAVVLTISPSVCFSSVFRPVISYLVGLEDYEEFRFSLGLKEKELFESVAAEQGYAGSALYLRFMREIFPEEERRRKYTAQAIINGLTKLFFAEIQFAYGLVPRDDIKNFFNAIEQGTYNSIQWGQEISQGGSKTGCLTILIPTNQDQDGSCTIRVERKTLIQAIKRFKLEKLKLE